MAFSTGITPHSSAPCHGVEHLAAPPKLPGIPQPPGERHKALMPWRARPTARSLLRCAESFAFRQVYPNRKGAWVARGGTGNPFLSGSSLCFLWISLTFHTGPDGCLQVDFCKPALPCSKIRAQPRHPTAAALAGKPPPAGQGLQGQGTGAHASLGATFGPWGHHGQAGRSESERWQRQKAALNFEGWTGFPPRRGNGFAGRWGRSLNLT